jgi:tryptophanyl-tRNA synthetase
LIGSIKTDSRAPGEPKDTEGSALFQIYQAFAQPHETAQLREDFAAGISWADAKQKLFERIDAEITPMRATYEHLMAHPAELEALLLQGAAKARAIASPFITKLRHAVGLRDLRQQTSAKVATEKVALPSFKQYRESDGQFYFKLVDAQGKLLLTSTGFASPKDAGQMVKALQDDLQALTSVQAQLQLAPGVVLDEAQAALQALREAKS